MKKTFKILPLFLLIIGMAAGTTMLLKNRDKVYGNSSLAGVKVPAFQTSYIKSEPQPPVDFEKAAASAVPTVVHIRTVIKTNEVADKEQQQNPFEGEGNDLFKKFFGDNGAPQQQQPDQRASGSGVIISADGYIVTNNHVVDGASEIVVTLNDRKNYKAKVIGTDVNTDLALIKIEGHDLPVMSLGNSDDARLGQWVLAIGYPLNLDVTVTEGIISAKSRNIGINRQGTSPVESFIQTDAAVNPGSSGGALINTNGELIGINAAIASPTGSYAGYAYSIPSNLVRKVIDDIMRFGNVQRGYLGISMAPQQMDEAKKKELGINDDVNGVWIADLDPNGAAAVAGLKKGDAILKINDVYVSTSSQLAEQIARQNPGDKLKVTYLRGDTENTAEVILKNKLGTFTSQKTSAIESLGAEFSTVNEEDAAKMGIDGGVQVTKIQDGILNSQTKMRPGFVITKIGDQNIKSVEDLKETLSNQSANFQIQGIYPGNKEVYYYGINDFKK